jgi:iron complex outermembrane recepter protein
MSNRNALRQAVRFALLTGTVTAAVSAQAQETQALEEVVVTGTRLRQPNLTAISPVATVTNEDFKLQGVTRVEDLINNLPQAVADFGGNVSNGATGGATVNLRGLGSQRTMVLVNGRRLMPGDPTQNGNSVADLNQIPSALIERVEVLTGGASAVYGADAVAGVVNFIMDTNFEGARLDYQYSFYDHHNGNSAASAVSDAGFALPSSSVTDGYTTDITFTLGMNTSDGRGNATFYAGYRTLDALRESERDYSACSLGSGDVFDSCAGSSTTAPARFQPAFQTGEAAGAENSAFPGVTPRGPNGELLPYGGGSYSFNYAPYNYYQRPDERYTAGAFMHYEVSDKADVYAELMFMDDRTDAVIAPSGAFRGSGPFGSAYAVNCDNPFLTAEEVDYFCTQQGLGPTDDALLSIGRRNVEGGGRSNDLQHTSYRGVAGVRGDFSEHWGYDIYGLYGTTKFESTYRNDFSSRRVSNALLAVDDGTGNTVCRVNVDADVTNDDPACVPWNIFVPNGVTANQLGYLQVPGFQNGATTETVISGAINGDLTDYGVKLPTASQGLAVAFGAEYREEKSYLRNDVSFSTGDLLGQGGATLDTSGSFNVQELFAEARLPLADGLPFAQGASVEAGYRYSDYNLGFTTDTYKFGLDWAPVNAIRFRGSYQRAVRAPNIQELFRPQVVQLDGSTDPCAVDNPGVDTPKATAAECARSGVTAAQYGQIASNPASQYNGLTGGNPDLQPESADTYSFGFVFTPDFVPGLSWTVDWYNIKVEDVINGVGADLALNTCLTNGDPLFCSLVNRAPGSGSLWLGFSGYMIDTNQNLGSLETTGIDTEINYRFDLGNSGHALGLSLVGTYVDELVTEPLPGFPTYDCKGLFGNVCGVSTPEWRHKARATWFSPWNLDLTLTWRYIDAVDNENLTDNPNFSFDPDTPATDRKLDSQNYLDLAATYSLDTEIADLVFRVGANNITDEDPPIFGNDVSVSVFANGNTFPQVYDTLGRYWFFNISAKF